MITGPSGIGKSTLLKLFLGIFEPDSGAILIQGEGERVTINRSTRRLFAYVPPLDENGIGLSEGRRLPEPS